jgi:hypothetical protein
MPCADGSIRCLLWEKPWHAGARQLNNVELEWGNRMVMRHTARTALNYGLVLAVLTGISGCGLFGGGGGGSGLFGGKRNNTVQDSTNPNAGAQSYEAKQERGTKIQDLFAKSADPNTTVEVNKYLWLAAQDVLNFLPIESVDPFTGVLVTGYGTPPGGGRAYRATVYVQDPALDARSLRVALQSRGGGAVAPETARAVEDAILTRARQLRIQDSKL